MALECGSLPGVFCYLMFQVLSGLDFCFTYIDEMLIYSASWKEHVHHLKAVFKCLKETNLKLKLTKYQFFKKPFHYLVHLISEKSIQPLPEKVSTIKDIKEPSNVEELQHFLGWTGYYKKVCEAVC